MGITVTDRAAEEIKRITEGKPVYLRVGVKGGGCSGFNYTLGLEDIIIEIDQLFESCGISIACDPKSFLYLNGMEIDFETSLMGRGFKFKNPNSTNSCGCGESFSV